MDKSRVKIVRDFGLSSIVKGIQNELKAHSDFDVSFLPKLNDQLEIAALLADINAQVQLLENKYVKAQQIKQGMMQELLTGRIRLV